MLLTCYNTKNERAHLAYYPLQDYPLATEKPRGKSLHKRAADVNITYGAEVGVALAQHLTSELQYDSP